MGKKSAKSRELKNIPYRLTEFNLSYDTIIDIYKMTLPYSKIYVNIIFLKYMILS
jgi:hypothetical protein